MKPDCNEVFKDRRQVFEHFFTQHCDKFSTNCPFKNCTQQINSNAVSWRSRLFQHMRLSHIRNICNNCGRSINELNYLRHQKRCQIKNNANKLPVNLGECDNCSDTMLKSSLPAHFQVCHRSNELERDVPKCPIVGCSKIFSSYSKMLRHRRTCKIMRILCPADKCDILLKKSELRNHLKEVHGRNQRTCEKCNVLVNFEDYNIHYLQCMGTAHKFEAVFVTEINDCGLEYPATDPLHI